MKAVSGGGIMNRKAPTMFVAILLLWGGVALPALAQNSDAVRARIAAYRQLGASFKAVNDMVRRGDVAGPAFRQAAQQVGASARHQYRLFPQNSRTGQGIRTAARPEIWTMPAEFKAAQDAFAREALLFSKAANGGDVSAIRSQVRKLGGTCKSCHDRFRVESD